MADPTTTNIVLAVPGHAADVDTWDSPLNSNANILDAIAGSVTTKSLTNANVTLTTAESRVSILRFTGTLTGTCAITLGPVIKSWICENLTTGAFLVRVQGSPGTGNLVALRPGTSQIYWDGTNVSYINLGGVGDYWDTSEADTPVWVTGCTVPPALKCAGGTFSAVTYPILNFRLGGTTLPDFRGRSPAYLNGGTNRITTAVSGIDGDTRFSAGGAQSLTIGQVNLPNVSPIFTGSLIAAQTLSLNQAVLKANGITAGSIAGGTGLGTAFVPDVTIPAFTPAGTISALGSGTALASMNPAVISGVRMIWAG